MAEQQHRPDPDETEPLRSPALLTSLAAAVLAALVAFGVNLSDGQTTAVLGLVAALAPLVVWAWGRRRAYAPATVARLLGAHRRQTAQHSASGASSETDR